MTRQEPGDPEQTPSDSSQPLSLPKDSQPAGEFDHDRPPREPKLPLPHPLEAFLAAMSPIRRACWALAAAHVLAVLFLATVCASLGNSGPDFPTAMLFSLAVAQSALVAMYVGLGGDPASLRWILLFPGWLLTAGALAAGLDELDVWPFMFTGIVIAIGLITALAMRSQYGPLHTGDVTGQRDVLQFGIRHLLLLTTVAALWAALVKADVFRLGNQPFLLIAAIASAFGVGVSASFWAMLGRTSPWPWRVLAVLATSHAAGWVSASLVQTAAWYWFVVMPTAAAAMLMATLAFVRRLGLRWTHGDASG